MSIQFRVSSFATLLVLSPALAFAQSIPNVNVYPSVGYDNGIPYTSWMISFPSGGGDRFNVDMNADLVGLDVIGMKIELMATQPTGTLGMVAFCRSNLSLDPTGTTPDTVGGVISGTSNPTGVAPSSSAGFCPGYAGIDLADFTGGTDTHAVMGMVAGNTAFWLCSDTGAPAGRTYWSTNDYATPAVPLTITNWMMRAVITGQPDTLTIDGQSVANVVDNAALSFEFWGTPGTPLYLQGLLVGGTTWVSLPGFVLPTGVYNFAPPGLGPDNGGVSGSLGNSCPPVGTQLLFAAFWPDATQLKPNGHPTIKLTPTATLNISLSSKVCCPLTCYGLNDDGKLDTNVWKVGYPSGGGDWFSVRCGPVPAGVTNLLSLQSACWDFNGTGGSFQSAGAYKANLALDPTGNTLDPNNPISAVGGASASVAPGAAQWGYANATLFDFADASATLGSVVHVGLRFNSGDTGLWEASDSNGWADDPAPNCGVIPNTTSAFTSNNFATPAIPSPFQNYMQKLNWN